MSRKIVIFGSCRNKLSRECAVVGWLCFGGTNNIFYDFIFTHLINIVIIWAISAKGRKQEGGLPHSSGQTLLSSFSLTKKIFDIFFIFSFYCQFCNVKQRKSIKQGDCSWRLIFQQSITLFKNWPIHISSSEIN